MGNNDVGKLVLRLTLGVLLLLHGVHKILTGIAPIHDLVAAHHLPDFIAYFVYVGEVLAPILIILGVLTRLGAALIVIDMIAAVALAGMGRIFALNANGGYALELEAFYMFGALAVALLGAGRLALNRQSLLN